MLKEATRSGVDVGRILAIAQAIAPNPSVFDASLGIDEGCLSAEKLVAVLHQGVRGEDAAHLMSCATCVENVRNFQTVVLKSERDFVGNALKKAASKGENLFKEGFFPVVLAIPDKLISIQKEQEHGLVFTCGMFPLISGFDEIDVSSLRASGAIVSKAAPKVEFVDLNEDGTTDFIKLTFSDGHLAARVREAISGHQNVVDTVQINGIISPKKKSKRLVGQASIEFGNAVDLTRG